MLESHSESLTFPGEGSTPCPTNVSHLLMKFHQMFGHDLVVLRCSRNHLLKKVLRPKICCSILSIKAIQLMLLYNILLNQIPTRYYCF